MSAADLRINQLVHQAGLGRLISVSKVDGGLSNTVLKLTTTAGRFAYRAASSLQATGGNAAADLAIACVAGRLGLGPEIVFSTEDGSETIAKWLEGAQMTRYKFRACAALMAQAIELLSRLHSVSVDVGQFSVTALIDAYTHDSVLSSAGIRAADVGQLRRRAIELQQTIEVSTVCHNDPMPKNWLCCGGHLRLLDFEFGGVFDPAWDFATLSNECGRDVVLTRLHSDPSRRGILQRTRAWMPIVDGLWALYAAKMSMQSPPRRETLLRVAHKRWSRFLAS